jgi:hypothetical protein
MDLDTKTTLVGYKPLIYYKTGHIKHAHKILVLSNSWIQVILVFFRKFDSFGLIVRFRLVNFGP